MSACARCTLNLHRSDVRAIYSNEKQKQLVIFCCCFFTITPIERVDDSSLQWTNDSSTLFKAIRCHSQHVYCCTKSVSKQDLIQRTNCFEWCAMQLLCQVENYRMCWLVLKCSRTCPSSTHQWWICHVKCLYWCSLGIPMLAKQHTSFAILMGFPNRKVNGILHYIMHVHELQVTKP